MKRYCNFRSLFATIVAIGIVFLVFIILLTRRHGRLKMGLPTPRNVSTVNYDHDTAEFLTHYSIYCEKFLRPHILNMQNYSRETPLCPCIPNDLGLYFVRDI